MEPEIRTWAAFVVAGVRTRAQAGKTDLGALWGVLDQRGPDRLPRPRGARAFGVASNFDETTDEFDYLAGYEVDPARGSLDDFDAVAIPSGTYAEFWTTLPELMATIRHAHHDWILASPYRRGDGPEF